MLRQATQNLITAIYPRLSHVPYRNGKIFYTSITSLSHISKITGDETVKDELDGIKRKEKHNTDGPAVVVSNIAET